MEPAAPCSRAARARFTRPRRCCRAGSREPAIALYAFCRLADDAVDLGDDRAAAVDAIAGAARSRLSWPADGPWPPIAPSPTSCADFRFRAQLPEALLEGLAWDAEGRRYETLPRAVRLCGAGRRHGRRHDDAGDGAALAGDRRARLRSRRRDATHQYRPRCRRGCARRPALSAAVMAARGRHRSRCLAGQAGVYPRDRRDRATVA